MPFCWICHKVAYVVKHEKNVYKIGLQSNFFKHATSGQNDKGFLLTSTFVPKGLSAPALGLYTCIKALKYIPGPGVRWAFTGPLVLWDFFSDLSIYTFHGNFFIYLFFRLEYSYFPWEILNIFQAWVFILSMEISLFGRLISCPCPTSTRTQDSVCRCQ